MSHQHYSNKVKEMKRNKRMGSNGPERRSTGMGSPRGAETNFTAPIPGLENMFFGRGNEFSKCGRRASKLCGITGLHMILGGCCGYVDVRKTHI